MIVYRPSVLRREVGESDDHSLVRRARTETDDPVAPELQISTIARPRSKSTSTLVRSESVEVDPHSPENQISGIAPLQLPVMVQVQLLSSCKLRANGVYVLYISP